MAIVPQRGSLVYKTLVVPRKGRIIDIGRRANGVCGLRERFRYRFLGVGWTVNKSRSCAFRRVVIAPDVVISHDRIRTQTIRFLCLGCRERRVLELLFWADNSTAM